QGAMCSLCCRALGGAAATCRPRPAGAGRPAAGGGGLGPSAAVAAAPAREERLERCRGWERQSARQPCDCRRVLGRSGGPEAWLQHPRQGEARESDQAAHPQHARPARPRARQAAAGAPAAPAGPAEPARGARAGARAGASAPSETERTIGHLIRRHRASHQLRRTVQVLVHQHSGVQGRPGLRQVSPVRVAARQAAPAGRGRRPGAPALRERHGTRWRDAREIDARFRGKHGQASHARTSGVAAGFEPGARVGSRAVAAASLEPGACAGSRRHGERQNGVDGPRPGEGVAGFRQSPSQLCWGVQVLPQSPRLQGWHVLQTLPRVRVAHPSKVWGTGGRDSPL
ncbi:unnamed protein product, partial [Prorocentrum cordatum]